MRSPLAVQLLLTVPAKRKAQSYCNIHAYGTIAFVSPWLVCQDRAGWLGSYYRDIHDVGLRGCCIRQPFVDCEALNFAFDQKLTDPVLSRRWVMEGLPSEILQVAYDKTPVAEARVTVGRVCHACAAPPVARQRRQQHPQAPTAAPLLPSWCFKELRDREDLLSRRRVALA